ncbi:MAG: DUF190 domain-containing protein [Leptolyngbya sp. SIO1E4]|nr:DUF190 domain-containing protein [Leptolyngbya sp. SIO1E4]
MPPWKKLSIYTSEGSRFGTRPLHSAIIATALEQELYSVMALKAMEGFGPQMAILTANQMALASDLPIEVRILDEAAIIEAFLTDQAEMLTGCLITLEDIEIVQLPPSVLS